MAKTKKATASPSKKPRSKSDVFRDLSETTELTRKQVASIFDRMAELIRVDLSKGCGVFTVPGLMKITVQHRPATKARPGRNPFTGEEIMIKAKPARKVVKVRALKNLKAMV